MPPKTSPAEKLFVLTMTLEQSLQSEDWPSVTVLLDERNRLLDSLAKSALSSSDQKFLARATLVEARCQALLGSMRRAVVDSIRQSFQSRQARSAYHMSGTLVTLDQDM